MGSLFRVGKMAACQRELDQIRECAARGAWHISHNGNVVSEAAELTLDQYIDWRLAGKPIYKPRAWAKAVAADFAKLLLRAKKRLTSLVDSHDLTAVEAFSSGVSVVAPRAEEDRMDQRKEIRRLMKDGRYRVTEKQRLAVELILKGLSFAEGARELSIDRASFRDIFRRAIARIRNSKKWVL